MKLLSGLCSIYAIKTESWDTNLRRGAIFCLFITIFIAVFFLWEFPLISNVHPALKPFKFSISFVFYLGSLSILLPQVQMSKWLRKTLVWSFLATMVLEMIPIVFQPLRGTTSHFNVSSPLNTFFWNLMAVAILVTTIATITLACLASAKPFVSVGRGESDKATSLSWRISLWCFLLVAVSGFLMSENMSHTVGGVDSSEGYFFTNWSKTLGDLRVSHFLSLHALQALPFFSWTTKKLHLNFKSRKILNGTFIVLYLAVIIYALVIALMGKPIF